MIKGVLIDISGVITQGDRLISGAGAGLARLRGRGLPIRFVTNTSRKPSSSLVALLRDLGVAVRPEEVLTPASAVAAYLLATGKTAHFLIHPALAPDFAGVRLPAPGEAPDAVVVGDAADGFTYQALNACFRHLTTGAEFLALARNRTFRDSDGGLSLDMGAFVAALEYASGQPARIFGKPAPDFFQAALAGMGLAAEEAVMVGDDAEADVAGALAAGIGAGVLVRTGKYARGVEDRVDPAPTHVADDLGAAVDWILEGQSIR